MTDTMPTLPESEATGRAAALYADIRDVLGVPVVNLIWRRLAHFPGALEWAWGAVRPLYAGGAADAAAAAIQARTPLPDLPPWPREMLPAMGLGEAESAAILHILASLGESGVRGRPIDRLLKSYRSVPQPEKLRLRP